MAKLKVHAKGGSVLVRSRLLHSEQLSERELQLLMTHRFGSLLPPRVSAKNKIEYAGSDLAVLKGFLKNGTDQRAFFTIIAHILEAIQDIEHGGLSLRNLELGPDRVFINPATLELRCVYQPIVSTEHTASTLTCLRDIALVAEHAKKADNSFLHPFILFLDHMERFSVSELEGYIRRAAPDVYSRMRRDFDEDAPPVHRAPKSLHPDSSYDLLSARSGLLDDPDSIGLMEDSIGLTDMSGSLTDGIAQTVLLGEERDRTTPLTQTGTQARIIRLATGEEAFINKSVFRVGKERAHVDYCITGNKTISRIHAEIVNRDGEYYLYDNHSTNKSYINGRMIPTQKETRIASGDILKFADEEFEFRI